ncbi:uncharacterized protein LOC112088570 [Eutrema salsugineum]|uniref:uncharacterized protein LOC112088570 n=1 Tax=Eutrema salsugineum TaxID=72664 RepID=UPI000CED5209|nr:uncharacterized protein LOC112088570 [Eutrema salsugineum]
MVTNNFKRNGEKLDEVRIMEKVLRSLDSKFEHIVTVIEETKDLETMTMEQLLGLRRKEEEGRHHRAIEEKSNYVEEISQEDDMLLMAYKKDEQEEVHKWYLDSGASNHMCGKRSMFVELDESVK